MKPILVTLALSCLAGSALAAPAHETPSQASAASSRRRGDMMSCAGALRSTPGADKILPGPRDRTLWLRLRYVPKKKEERGDKIGELRKREFKPFAFLFGKGGQKRGGLGKNPFGLGKDGKNFDFLKAIGYGFQLDKKLRSGQKVDLEKELASQFGKGSDVEKPAKGGKGAKDSTDVKNKEKAKASKDKYEKGVQKASSGGKGAGNGSYKQDVGKDYGEEPSKEPSKDYGKKSKDSSEDSDKKGKDSSEKSKYSSKDSGKKDSGKEDAGS